MFKFILLGAILVTDIADCCVKCQEFLLQELKEIDEAIDDALNDSDCMTIYTYYFLKGAEAQAFRTLDFVEDNCEGMEESSVRIRKPISLN